MVGRGRFAMVQHNQSLCTRPGFGLRFAAETWFLGTAEQPTFAASKQLELTNVVPYKQGLLYESLLRIFMFSVFTFVSIFAFVEVP